MASRFFSSGLFLKVASVKVDLSCMNNLWVHPELKSTGVGYGSYSYAQRLQRAYAVQRREAVLHSPMLQSFILAVLVLLPLCVGLILFKSYGSSTTVMDWVDSHFFPSYRHHVAPLDKNSFLAGLTREERDDLDSKIFYISTIIKDARESVNSEQLATTIVAESKAAGYDPLFVTAVIFAESTFKQAAKSNRGALGLMQILPDTAKFIARVDGHDWRGSWSLTNDPSYNIRLGIAYLKHLESDYNLSTEQMLMAYNWGPANVVKYLKREKHPPTETKNYVKKITKMHKNWSSDFAERKSAFKYMAVNYYGADVSVTRSES